MTLTDTAQADRIGEAAALSKPPPDRAEEEAARVQRPLYRAVTHGRGLVGLILVLVIAAAGVFAGLLAPHEPNAQIEGANLVGPSSTYWLGTDEVNRDVLSRVLHGIQIDLIIICTAVPIGAIVGSLIGLVSSLSRFSDVVAQRLFDVVLAFPVLILGIALAAIAGPGASTIVLVIAVAQVPIFGRLLRSSLLRVREMPYVEAAQVIGAGRWWILRRHILPNSAEPLLVQLALSMSVAVFVESAMSFLGIGVRPPDPSLGSIVSDAVRNLDANPGLALGPLVVVVGLVLGFLLIAQALGRARRI